MSAANQIPLIPVVAADGPSRAAALRSTFALLRPNAPRPRIHGAHAPAQRHPPAISAARRAMAPSNVPDVLPASPVHAYTMILEVQEERQREQWARAHLQPATAGPAVPKGWRQGVQLRPPLYDLKSGQVPSLVQVALCHYLRWLQRVGPAAPAALPLASMPPGVRQLVLYHLSYYVTPTDATLHLWRDCGVQFLNLSNGRFSAPALAALLDDPATPAAAAPEDDAVPDAWDELAGSDGDDNDPPDKPSPSRPEAGGSGGWALESLDLSFCSLPQAAVVQTLTSSRRAAQLTHLNLSGVHFTVSDAGWALARLADHLLHLAVLEVHYCPWLTPAAVAAVDWTTKWRNLRVLGAHKSAVAADDVAAIRAYLAAVRPEICVVTDAP
ncbi:hypothetical protein H9P43_009934 [Blastocladiella emersonii ATCC 22665]|nr:hypothetical protein H9P43_009934 [Blastocladiella emersonii ATCC 22665]